MPQYIIHLKIRQPSQKHFAIYLTQIVFKGLIILAGTLLADSIGTIGSKLPKNTGAKPRTILIETNLQTTSARVRR